MILPKLRPVHRSHRLGLAGVALFAIAACHDKGGGDPAANAASAGGAVNAVADPAVNAAAAPASDVPATQPSSASGTGFQPLASQAVKDAIHRALTIGAIQRWQDGSVSGYAVPSRTADPHGCRAVRYTVDQQPEVSYPVITACDAGRAQ